MPSVVHVQALDGLDAAERMRFGFIGFSYFNILERLYMEHRAGIGSGLWEVEQTALIALLAFPGMAQWWRENPISFGPEFRARANQLLADQERAQPEDA